MLDLRWRCRDDVTLTPRDDGVDVVVGGGPGVPVLMPPGLAREAVRLNHGVSDDTIGNLADGDPATSARLFQFRHRLQKHGLLVVDLYCREQLVAILRPLSPTLDPRLPAARRTRNSTCWTLSRFALLRREGRHLVLECTEAPCDIVIEDRNLVQWIHDAAASVEPESGSVQAAVLAFLEGLGFVEDPGGREPPARQMWEFHDRLFHRRTRSHGDLRPFGGIYRFRELSEDGYVDRLPSPPAIRVPHAGETIDLPAPDTLTSASLQYVMENRRSRYQMGIEAVSLKQVAVLLYRVARVTRRLPNDLLHRPYPSGGAIHELEFYLAVRVCDGLAPGFHHYRSDVHALTRLRRESADRAAAAMVSDCAVAWGTAGEPQCLVVVSSRLPRLAWKYAATAYRTSVLNAGVVLQSLYLVATDIGLNGSAAGSGNPDLFVQATGVPSWEETSIAEFGFGSRPAPDDAKGAGGPPR